jgi:uncharacterized protein YkwD
MHRAWIVALSGALLTSCGGDGAAGLPGGVVEGYCDPTEGWSSSWAADEDEVLVLINEHRAEGAHCGGRSTFDPAAPLQMEPRLQCAARIHSLDMFERDYFSHTSPEGDGPSLRIEAAGYDARGWGENIARGSQSPASVVALWMDSDGHCANIMAANYEHIGVGRVERLWTLVFARPR